MRQTGEVRDRTSDPLFTGRAVRYSQPELVQIIRLNAVAAFHNLIKLSNYQFSCQQAVNGSSVACLHANESD